MSSAELDWLIGPANPPKGGIARTRLMLAALLLIALIALSSYYWFSSDRSSSSQASLRNVPVIDSPPVVDAPFAPKALRDMSADEAKAWNADMAAEDKAIVPARAFLIDLAQGIGLARSLDCLTTAIYYEAANEPVDGQRAVAQVILNRVRHPAYPHSICAVVFQGAERPTGCQFTFACDGSLARKPVPALLSRARTVAAAALAGYVYRPVGWATHYHANYVAPYWAAQLTKVGAVGAHIFYRWRGDWGLERAFSATYDGSETMAWPSLPAVADVEREDATEEVPIPSDRPILAHAKSDLVVDEGEGATARSPSSTPVEPKATRWVLTRPATDQRSGEKAQGAVTAPATQP